MQNQEYYNGVHIAVANNDTEAISGFNKNACIYVMDSSHDSVDYISSSKGISFDWEKDQIGLSPANCSFEVEYPSAKAAHTRMSLPDHILRSVANDNKGFADEVSRGVIDKPMVQLVRAFAGLGPHADPLLIDHLTMAVCYRAVSWFSPAQAVNDNQPGRISRAIEYVNDNLSKSISIRELSAIACMSQFHFARKFKKVTGRTPHRYVMEKRLDKAKLLLADPAATVTAAGYASGFENQAHFSTAFKAYVGATPSDYRQQILPP